MALTSANALKTLIEGLGLGLSAYRSGPPEGLARPYVTIQEEIALVPDPLEDATMTTGQETVQIDLWQDLRNLVTGDTGENYALAPALRRGLHGARLIPIGTKITYAVLVRSSARMEEPKDNIIHTAITVDIFREL